MNASIDQICETDPTGEGGEAWGTREAQLELINSTLKEGMKTSCYTAVRLAEFVQSHKNLKFFVRPEGSKYSQFKPANVMPGFGGGLGAVIWDPSETVHYWIRPPKIEKKEEITQRGGLVIKKITAEITGSSDIIPPWICLYHEIGHAIQCFKSPKWFFSCLNNNMAGMREIEQDNLEKVERYLLQAAGCPPRIDYFGQTAVAGVTGSGTYKVSGPANKPRYDRI